MSSSTVPVSTWKGNIDGSGAGRVFRCTRTVYTAVMRQFGDWHDKLRSGLRHALAAAQSDDPESAQRQSEELVTKDLHDRLS